MLRDQSQSYKGPGYRQANKPQRGPCRWGTRVDWKLHWGRRLSLFCAVVSLL
jgi:hypothetical protein